MELINQAVADNLKRCREQGRYSLEALSKITGVSKSLLGQIERGEANPTISTVWKIANGLKVPFSEFVKRPENDFDIVEKNALTPLLEDEGRFRNYPLFPYDAKRPFEIYFIELDKGALLQAEPHPEGSQEFITVFSGELEVQVSGSTLVAKEGDALRFQADVPHLYRNTGSELCRVSMVIHYPK